MFERKPRRFRQRSNGRGHHPRDNGHGQMRMRSNLYSNSQTKNNFRPTQSAEKLLEKYNVLAKEAKSSGDETSCENYLQHADHFARIIEDKNKNKEKSKTNIVDKPVVDNQSSPKNTETTQENTIKNKE